jgi:hypothetical protein
MDLPTFLAALLSAILTPILTYIIRKLTPGSPQQELDYTAIIGGVLTVLIVLILFGK